MPKTTIDLMELMYLEACQETRVDTGTPYPCTQSQINLHRNHTIPSRNRGPFVSSIKATEDLMQHNHAKRTTERVMQHNNHANRTVVPPAERAAIKRLRGLVYAVDHGYLWNPDIAVKAFADLDLIFFGGHLSGNVLVGWRGSDAYFGSGPGAMAATETAPLSVFRRAERGQCVILLNAVTLFLEPGNEASRCPFERVVGTLLHEMVHAYDTVRCPTAKEVEGDGGGHDEHFGTRINVVHQRARRIMGIGAIDPGEPYLQNHILVDNLEDYQRCGHREARHRESLKQDRSSQNCGSSRREQSPRHRDQRGHGSRTREPRCLVM